MNIFLRGLYHPTLCLQRSLLFSVRNPRRSIRMRLKPSFASSILSLLQKDNKMVFLYLAYDIIVLEVGTHDSIKNLFYAYIQWRYLMGSYCTSICIYSTSYTHMPTCMCVWLRVNILRYQVYFTRCNIYMTNIKESTEKYKTKHTGKETEQNLLDSFLSIIHYRWNHMVSSLNLIKRKHQASRSNICSINVQ